MKLKVSLYVFQLAFPRTTTAWECTWSNLTDDLKSETRRYRSMAVHHTPWIKVVIQHPFPCMCCNGLWLLLWSAPLLHCDANTLLQSHPETCLSCIHSIHYTPKVCWTRYCDTLIFHGGGSVTTKIPLCITSRVVWVVCSWLPCL